MAYEIDNFKIVYDNEPQKPNSFSVGLARAMALMLSSEIN